MDVIFRGYAVTRVNRWTMTPDDLQIVLDKVEADPLLRACRKTTRRLRLLVADEPIRVLEELEQLAETYAASALYIAPTADLFRCVPASTVRRHMAAEGWRSVDDRVFLAAAAGSGDPAVFVRRTIPPGRTVFPPDHSWLIDAPSVMTMSSRELKLALELGDNQHPPFVVFRLTLARMLRVGVMVRIPNALDAAAAGQLQWNPSGLRLGQEYVDRAVPIEAVEEIVWKP